MNIGRLVLIVFLLNLGLPPKVSLADNGRLQDGGASLRLPQNKPVLFVTHGTRGYDYSQSAKTGIDRTVEVFESMGWPTVYLNTLMIVTGSRISSRI